MKNLEIDLRMLERKNLHFLHLLIGKNVVMFSAKLNYETLKKIDRTRTVIFHPGIVNDVFDTNSLSGVEFSVFLKIMIAKLNPKLGMKFDITWWLEN